MVNHNDEYLDNVFHALADPTRRAIVRLMEEGERSVKELAEPFNMSLAAISKHIKVLERANLLERKVVGRTHMCKLNGETLAVAAEWLRYYERYWTQRFDLLEEELLKAEKKYH